jgi:aspartyl-tRNA(Asn)/glutamyl-tRNA(Gln) amidotransferase subunit C
MTIDRSIVERITRLAYIGLSETEIDEMAGQLSTVLAHVSKLQQVDTDGVEPTGHAVPVRDAMRADVVAPSWSAAEVLANAPHREGDLFEVQAVLD